MPDTRERISDTAGGATGSGDGEGAGGALSAALHGPGADRLKDEARAYLMAQAERALVGVGRKLGDATVKLNDVAEGRSPGFARLALDGGRKLASGKGPLRSAVEVGGSHLKDAVTGSLKGALDKARGKGGKSGSGQKPTVILEHVDVGVPVREAYEQWTRYEEFATFTKGVRDATEVSETESHWKLKVFWSSRSWTARLIDQVPEERLAWTSEGAKGTTKGVVSFHPLGERLTRVVLVIEYYPKGLFERTGNLWRAQGRRARLDLKHFARHVSLRSAAQDDTDTETDAEDVEPEEDAEDMAYHEDDDTYSEETDEADEADEDDADDGYEDYADEDGVYEEEDDGEPEDAAEEADVDAEDEAEDEADEDEPVAAARSRR
ncbi:Polyketide cyclase / dehydrase and lipid transport [Streptomyces sp. YIM 121038]|uniref:SRPBCC family protein n=1 Tax=Streptomyces sp. YIM 121038 TaxID=2136401 RepID=UPI001110284C|nr:SRPBCC family protein [Streptomyces sp. YIM 121038]QCX80046.1 Polyketide cyclase / dehydrase and lipid transport [Streptomyces sp. YIM 121038]